MSEEVANAMFRSRYDVNKEEVDYFCNALTNLLSPLGKASLSDWLKHSQKDMQPTELMNELFLFIESETGLKE